MIKKQNPYIRIITIISDDSDEYQCSAPVNENEQERREAEDKQFEIEQEEGRIKWKIAKANKFWFVLININS